jgi:hypothetical protein
MLIEVFQDELLKVMKDIQDHPNALLCLVYVLTATHPSKGTIILNLSDMSDHLSIGKIEVDDAIQILEKRGVVLAGKREEDENLFQLSESLFRPKKKPNEKKSFFEESAETDLDPVEDVLDQMKLKSLRKG